MDWVCYICLGCIQQSKKLSIENKLLHEVTSRIFGESLPLLDSINSFSFYRAAARCNKGIEVLFAVALEHFVLVQVRVLRGPSSADDTVKKIRHLIHCQWCEERIFKREGNMIEGNSIL